ncbi:MAG: class I SAM-dependent methyltransferase [Chloroflexi bacterium]|nr:class I SAM-dependent methyltransferase [Chloroflexota bacterium]MBT4074494.1 class I SAM-dependent methyltransferase [Chloroflexota bacterium]
MPQNIYDDPTFFAAYDRMRTHGIALAGALEEPAIRSLLPDVTGMSVLDLGCGTGVMSRWLIESGADQVTGVDVSELMLAKASEHQDSRIRYIHKDAESLEFPEGSFDLVVSSLMFHYIDDLQPVLSSIRRWLKPGGQLVFSTEHPIYTAAQGVHGDQWVKDDSGKNMAWLVDGYSSEGKRVSTWWVDGVVRYHRTVATLVNWLVESGFHLTRMLEPYATEEAERDQPLFLDERKRPVFLFISASADDDL